jgi:hypothetical protein
MLVALVLVVVIEAAVMHAILGASSPLVRALVAVAHASVVVWLVTRFLASRRRASSRS